MSKRKRNKGQEGPWLKEWKKHCHAVTCCPHVTCMAAYRAKKGAGKDTTDVINTGGVAS